MSRNTRSKISRIVRLYKREGPRWKLGKDLSHLNKRKRRFDLPSDFTMNEYNNLIVHIITNKSSYIYLYELTTFTQLYYVFSSDDWIVIVGENTIMETAMHSSNPNSYLSQEKGYTYIGTVEEVIKWKPSN